MSLKITKVYGGTEREILDKKHNILIAISLGNKWFTKENLREYIKWTLKNSKDRVLIWIADKIYAVNYEVKDKKSPEASLRRALKEGNKKLLIVKEILSELPKERVGRINIVRCIDIENLNDYKILKEYFYKKFNNDGRFKDAILDIVKNSTSLKFSEIELEKLSEYVLNELPVILESFSYQGIEYSCYPYPINTKIVEFVEKIQNREIFPEIYNEIKFKNMVCVQLGVEK